jgi:N-acetylmuramic acid 6-phosphate etherase
MARGGRLIYVGAGTAGRIGVLDAVECPPTFNSQPGQVTAVLAGGVEAIYESIEGAEDDVEAAALQLNELGLTMNDAVVGISASGRTPYVLAGVRHARKRGALTVGLACNPQAQLSELVEHPIEVIVGPEFISGSTRLKAGTAQKLVLNMISTIAMVRLGKTFGNLMVDVQATNDKLRARAVRMVAEITSCSDADALAAVGEANGDTRVAILMLTHRLDATAAQLLLREYGRSLRKAMKAQ